MKPLKGRKLKMGLLCLGSVLWPPCCWVKIGTVPFYHEEMVETFTVLDAFFSGSRNMSQTQGDKKGLALYKYP